MNARMKAGIVYAVAAAVIIASWIGNAAVYRHNQLPEAGFLQHYIEATDNGGHIELLYLANRSDPRRIVGVTIEGLPWVKFQASSGGNEMRYQRVEELMAIIDPRQGQPGEAEEDGPLVIREVTAHYSDGTSERKNVGEIRLYREAARAESEDGEGAAGAENAVVSKDGNTDRIEDGNTGADTGGNTGTSAGTEAVDRPFSFGSGGSSSDGAGHGTIAIQRPITWTDVYSAWLPVLGDAFEWQVSADSEQLELPADLDAHQSLTLKYQFRLDDHPAHDMDVFQLIMRMSFRERNDQIWDYSVYAAYKPRMTEAQVRAYVQGKRRERA